MGSTLQERAEGKRKPGERRNPKKRGKASRPKRRGGIGGNMEHGDSLHAVRKSRRLRKIPVPLKRPGKKITEYKKGESCERLVGERREAVTCRCRRRKSATGKGLSKQRSRVPQGYGGDYGGKKPLAALHPTRKNQRTWKNDWGDKGSREGH